MREVQPAPRRSTFRARLCHPVLAVSVAFVVGCDGREGPSTAREDRAAPATTLATTPPTSTVPTDGRASEAPAPDTGDTSTTVAGLDGASTSSVSTPATADRSYLRALRSASHPGYDRVVFEFEGGVPGYRVTYVDRPLFEDGSGRPVEVDGSTVLQVRLERAATARIRGDRVFLTYRGPSRLRPSGTPVVVEVVKVGDFEAVLRWAVGSRHRVPFNVTTLTGPSRVVVDLEHPR